MFGFFKKFGKPKSKDMLVKQQIMRASISIGAAMGRPDKPRVVKDFSERICKDFLPLLPQNSIENCLPQVIAAYVLIMQARSLIVKNKSSAHAPILVSMARFCVLDTGKMMGFEDLGLMRITAEFAQEKGIDFYKDILEPL